MTDRYAGFVVTLDQNIREDDAQRIIEALEMIKGVQSVKPVIGNAELAIAQERAKNEFIRKHIAFLNQLREDPTL